MPSTPDYLPSPKLPWHCSRSWGTCDCHRAGCLALLGGTWQRCVFIAELTSLRELIGNSAAAMAEPWHPAMLRKSLSVGRISACAFCFEAETGVFSGLPLIGIKGRS